MRAKTKVSAIAAALSAAGLLGAFAASGFGGSGSASLASGHPLVGPVALESAASDSGLANAAGNAATKKPQLTQLITTDPLTVAGNGELVAVLKCPKKHKPVSGGAITPVAPAKVLISVLSRFNPNTLETPPRKFYVGVRNEQADPQEWLATVTCMKHVTEK